MNRPPYIPDDPEIVVVESSDALFTYKRARHETMVLLARPISGRFNELATWLLKQDPSHDKLVLSGLNFIPVVYNVERLDKFAHDPAMNWHEELALIRQDMRWMQRYMGEQAELRVVRDRGYHPDTYKFHQDGRVNKMPSGNPERLMCAYNKPVTECLRTVDAREGHWEKSGLQIFYQKAGAIPFRPGVGDIWRQTCERGGNALIHRAVAHDEGNWRLHKDTLPWNQPRLLAVC